MRPADVQDQILNGDETGVDCGGPDCTTTCAVGVACNIGSDCETGLCEDGLCAKFTAISVGESSACAITAKGAVKCGVGTFYQASDVMGLPGPATSISVGTDFACAVANGAVLCWGNDQSGMLGDGQMNAGGSTPVVVAGLSAGAAAGFSSACAVSSAGGAKCWGDNEQGELGSGSTMMSIA
ncbi:MAG TPA: hypothetical protein VGM56_01580, partial [Byssovorax sp.]